MAYSADLLYTPKQMSITKKLRIRN
jgi:hypothetical protein